MAIYGERSVAVRCPRQIVPEERTRVLQRAGRQTSPVRGGGRIEQKTDRDKTPHRRGVSRARPPSDTDNEDPELPRSVPMGGAGARCRCSRNVCASVKTVAVLALGGQWLGGCRSPYASWAREDCNPGSWRTMDVPRRPPQPGYGGQGQGCSIHGLRSTQPGDALAYGPYSIRPRQRS